MFQTLFVPFVRFVCWKLQQILCKTFPIPSKLRSKFRPNFGVKPVQTSEWFLRKRWKCDEYNRFYFYPYGTQKTVEFFRKRIPPISPVWATKDCVFCWKPWEPNIFLSEHFSLHECSSIASLILSLNLSLNLELFAPFVQKELTAFCEAIFEH